ncbi:MAG TPA: hypothetical protein VMZ27_01025 [Candidatus Saccharimonadales bacterium]|nr:hypothetical protein [Candidatus Saccharimonadales bacterium]
MNQILGLTGLVVTFVVGGCSSPGQKASQERPGIKIEKQTYHGWRDALRISNGKAFAIVVPSIGRIMQYGFEGTEGVFWENSFLLGQGFDAKTNEWINFGGDKTWPAPEGEWGKYTHNKSWKPPTGFDGVPCTAIVEGDEIVMESAVDPSYGIKARRRIHMDLNQPVLSVTTTYICQRGGPSLVGIWVITQLKDPERIIVPLPSERQRRNFFEPLSGKIPAGLKEVDGFLSMRRDKADFAKLGTEASSLLWVGSREMLRIDSRRLSGFEYPDKGSSAEIYTNPDPLKYIELEMLGPLQTLQPGNHIERTSVYTLIPRTQASPEAEAGKVYKNGP